MECGHPPQKPVHMRHSEFAEQLGGILCRTEQPSRQVFCARAEASQLFPIPVGPTNKAFWFCRTDSLRDFVAVVSYVASICSARTAATRTSVLMSVTVRAVHSIADSLRFDVQ